MNRISKDKAYQIIEKMYQNNSNAAELISRAKKIIQANDGNIYMNEQGDTSINQQFVFSATNIAKAAYGSLTITPDSMKKITLTNSKKYEDMSSVYETEDGHVLKTDKSEINNIELGDIRHDFEPSQFSGTDLVYDAFGESKYDPTAYKKRLNYAKATTKEYDKDGNLVMSTYRRELSDKKSTDVAKDKDQKDYVYEEFSTMKDENDKYVTVYGNSITDEEEVFSDEYSFDPEQTDKFVDKEKRKPVSLRVKQNQSAEMDGVLSYLSAIHTGKIKNIKSLEDKERITKLFSQHIHDTQQRVITSDNSIQKH